METIDRKNIGVMEYWSAGFRSILHHSIIPVLHTPFLFLPQHLLQGSVFSERFRPAEVFFEIGAGFDEILNDVVDAFVGHEGRGLKQARIGLDGFLDDGAIFFAHPFGEGFFGEGRFFLIRWMPAT